MPIPFPNDDTTWTAAGRPMRFTVAARAFVPIATDGVNQPTLAVTTTTTGSNQVTLTAGAFSTFGSTGNQSGQTYQILNGDGTVNQTINQTTGFGAATITDFGDTTAAHLPVGKPNVLGTGDVDCKVVLIRLLLWLHPH